jgi:hypothetical protein
MPQGDKSRGRFSTASGAGNVCATAGAATYSPAKAATRNSILRKQTIIMSFGGSYNSKAPCAELKRPQQAKI